MKNSIFIRSLIVASSRNKNHHHQANQLHTTHENWLLMRKQVFWSNLNDKIQILAVKKLIINWKFSCSAYKTSRKLLSDGEYCANNLNHVFDTDISYGKNSECRLDHRKVKFLNCCEKFQPYKIWLKFFRSKTGRISKVISERSRWNQIKLNDHHVINNLFYLLVCLVILDDL